LKLGNARVLRLLLLIGLASLGGCERGGTVSTELWGAERPAAPVLVRSLTLPSALPAGSTMNAGADGTLEIGRGGRVLAIDPESGVLLWESDLETQSGARVLGRGGERLYVRAGAELITLDADGEIRMRRDRLATAIVALDPFVRHVYTATETGAVIGLDPRLLRPRWAWPRLGRAATAMAVSPEGDRLYLALAPTAVGGESQVLVRDVQNGRVLHESTLPGAVRDLRVAANGVVFAMVGTGAGAEIHALRPGPEGLTAHWRRSADEWGLGAGAQLRVDHDGHRLAAFAAGPGGGLRMLDAESGDPIGDAMPAPIDAGFGANGTLFVLFAREIQVLR